MSKTVWCKAVESYDEALVNSAVEELFAQMPVCSTLGATSRVLLKPNLLAKHAPQACVTTHPAVVRAVVTALQKRGVTQITLADSCGGLYNTATMQGIYKQSGLAAVCEEMGVALYKACEEFERKTGGALVHSFHLIAPVETADFIINLPKFKTHVMTTMTGAVKNLFGTVPGLQKAEFHMRFSEKEKFGDMLVDLCECVKPQLSLMDGIMGMEGDGPAGGEVRKVGVLLASENPYQLDLAVCGIMGLDAARVPYLAAAMRRNLCGTAFEMQHAAGDTSKFARISGYKLPSGHAQIDFSARVPKPFRGIVPVIARAVAPRPVVNKAKCIGCAKCAEICPAHTIAVADKKAQVMKKDCIRCFCCHEMCPVKAMDVKRVSVFQL